MKGLQILLLAVGLGTLALRSKAALVIAISEPNSNLRFDYRGTLDLSGIPFVDSNLSLDEHALRSSTPTIGETFTAVANL